MHQEANICSTIWAGFRASSCSQRLAGFLPPATLFITPTLTDLLADATSSGGDAFASLYASLRVLVYITALIMCVVLLLIMYARGLIEHRKQSRAM